MYCFKRCLYAFRLAFIPLYRVCRSCFRSVLTNYVASHCVLPPAMPCTIFSALPPLLHCPASLGSPPLAASPVIMHSKIKMEGTRCLSFAWPNIRLTKVGLGLVPERLPKLIPARAEGFSPSQAKPRHSETFINLLSEAEQKSEIETNISRPAYKFARISAAPAAPAPPNGSWRSARHGYALLCSALPCQDSKLHTSNFKQVRPPQGMQQTTPSRSRSTSWRSGWHKNSAKAARDRSSSIFTPSTLYSPRPLAVLSTYFHLVFVSALLPLLHPATYPYNNEMGNYSAS